MGLICKCDKAPREKRSPNKAPRPPPCWHWPTAPGRTVSLTLAEPHPPTNWEHAQVVLILQGRVAIKTGQSKKNSNWGIPAFRKSVQVYLKKFIWGNVGITKVDIISSLSNSELTIYHIISQTPRKFFKNSLPKKRGLSKRYVYFQITIFQGLWRLCFILGGVSSIDEKHPGLLSSF